MTMLIFKQTSNHSFTSLQANASRSTPASGAFPGRFTFFSAVFIHILLFAPYAQAVRPFVTDVARIIAVGQVEVESWLEVGHADKTWNPAPAANFMAGATVNEWLEIIVGSGV